MKLLILLITAMIVAGCSSSPATSMQTAQSGKAPDETAALDTIAKINDAQANYFRRNRRYALTFDELVDAHLLNGAPSAAQTGYDFILRPSADAQTYSVSVIPTASSASVRHFFTDESGTVHAEAGRDASADSPKL